LSALPEEICASVLAVQKNQTQCSGGLRVSEFFRGRKKLRNELTIIIDWLWNCRSLNRSLNAIERMFCRIRDFGRIATRYDRSAANFLAAASASLPQSATSYESGT
jgi:hypothetical protein